MGAQGMLGKRSMRRGLLGLMALLMVCALIGGSEAERMDEPYANGDLLRKLLLIRYELRPERETKEMLSLESVMDHNTDLGERGSVLTKKTVTTQENGRSKTHLGALLHKNHLRKLVAYLKRLPNPLSQSNSAKLRSFFVNSCASMLDQMHSMATDQESKGEIMPVKDEAHQVRQAMVKARAHPVSIHAITKRLRQVHRLSKFITSLQHLRHLEQQQHQHRSKRLQAKPSAVREIVGRVARGESLTESAAEQQQLRQQRSQEEAQKSRQNAQTLMDSINIPETAPEHQQDSEDEDARALKHMPTAERSELEASLRSAAVVHPLDSGNGKEHANAKALLTAKQAVQQKSQQPTVLQQLKQLATSDAHSRSIARSAAKSVESHQPARKQSPVSRSRQVSTTRMAH